MVKTLYDIKIQAGNLNFPLPPLFVYANSAASVRILNVPKKIGSWEITDVVVAGSFPDNQLISVQCQRTGSCWVGTFPQTSRTGKSPNGYWVTAYGTDENGDPFSPITLGRGDLSVADWDRSVPGGQSTIYLHIFEEQPENPTVGDAYFDEGALKVWDGGKWSSTSVTKLSQLENDVGYLTSADVQTDKIINAEQTQYLRYDGKIFIRHQTQSGFGPWQEAGKFVTAVYVDNKIEEISGHIPTKLSQLDNDRFFVSRSAVEDMLPTKMSQLSNDAKYVQIVPEGARDSGLRQNVMMSWLSNDIGYVTSADVPARLSQLSNDVPYARQSDLDIVADEASEALNRVGGVEDDIIRIDSWSTDIQFDMDGVKAVIPATATEDNKLADKNYVDAQVASAVTTFRNW